MEEIPTGKGNGKMEKKRLKCHSVFWLHWYRAATMWSSNNADCISGGDSVFAMTASLSPILWCLILFVCVVISDKNQKIVQEQDLIWMEWHHTQEANHSLQTRRQSGVLNTETIWSLGIFFKLKKFKILLVSLQNALLISALQWSLITRGCLVMEWWSVWGESH